jgi:hypothetical protein
MIPFSDPHLFAMQEKGSSRRCSAECAPLPLAKGAHLSMVTVSTRDDTGTATILGVQLEPGENVQAWPSRKQPPVAR